MRIILLVFALVTAACEMRQESREPIDISWDRTELAMMGWTLSQPLDPAARGLPDSSVIEKRHDTSWGTFLSKLGANDTLHKFTNKDGNGYAIFRGEKLVDVFYTSI